MTSQSAAGGDLLESLQGRCLQVTGGIDEGEQRDDGRSRGKRGPSMPAAHAKSVPIATKNFYKGMRSLAQVAANMTSRANLPCDYRETAPACAVGVTVLAVAQGLTEHKNGRVSKEDERIAANRKPQAFLLQLGQIPLASMHQIFRGTIEGGSREGSPPVDITLWTGEEEAERWFELRKCEMLANGKAGKEAGEAGEGGTGETSAEQPSASGPPPPPPLSRQLMMGLITPEEDMRSKAAADDIGKWLQEECSEGLDDHDMRRVVNCLASPDKGITDREMLFTLPEKELLSILSPIREHGLKNFIVQKCKRKRPASIRYTDDTQPAKMRKTGNAGAVD
jgi:hypothetical protein